jgi:hypothetical protein
MSDDRGESIATTESRERAMFLGSMEDISSRIERFDAGACSRLDMAPRGDGSGKWVESRSDAK